MLYHMEVAFYHYGRLSPFEGKNTGLEQSILENKIRTRKLHFLTAM